MDNARPHVSREAMEFIDKKGILLFPHGPYSPDLAPADFLLFPQFKMKLAGQCYDREMDLQKASEANFKALTKGGILWVFEKWCQCHVKCIEEVGSYVEK